jgi:hypothetical protein
LFTSPSPSTSGGARALTSGTWTEPFPVHDLLQIVLTVALGAAALVSWERIVRERLLWKWRRRPPYSVASASPVWRRRVLRWLVACAILGAAATLFLRPVPSATDAVEVLAYGVLDGIALGLVLAAAMHRVLRALPGVAREAVSRVKLFLRGGPVRV